MQWQRVLLPSSIAISLSWFVVGTILRLEPEPMDPHAKAAIDLGAFVGKLASACLLEWRRHRAEKTTVGER
jgi:hypothetical protein